MITRAHLGKLLYQLKTVHIAPSIRFSTDTPPTSTTNEMAAATKTQSDKFLKYGLYYGLKLNFFHKMTILLSHQILFYTFRS